MQQVQLVAVICIIVVCTGSIQALTVSYCSSSRVIDIKKAEVSPSPLKFPGKIHIYLEAEIHDQLNSSKAVVNMKKTTGFFDITMPCGFPIKDFGSCTYADTCTVLDSHGKRLEKLFGTSVASYTCPVRPQKISIKDVEFQLPVLSAAQTKALTGGFRIQIRLTDNASHKEFLCLQVDISLDTGCTGWLCVGKRR